MLAAIINAPILLFRRMEKDKIEDKLLTKEEIKKVENYVLNTPALRTPFVIGGGSNRLSVLSVTHEKGLIFIHGNQYTGFTHLNERHNYWSEETYWKKTEKGVELDNPSKFNKNSIPVIDYFKISEILYSSENLQVDKNKNPDYLMFMMEKSKMKIMRGFATEWYSTRTLKLFTLFFQKNKSTIRRLSSISKEV
jgi:hypothetical protein